MDAKQLFHKDQLTDDERKAFEQAGISGAVRFGDFEAQFRSISGKFASVELTSGAVWIVVTGGYADFVLFTEQADRLLLDGTHPWEVASGGVDKALDLDIFRTIKRETAEETGIEITGAMPIAVAIKRKEAEIALPGIIVPTFDNEIWIADENLLWTDDHLKGGLVTIAEVNIGAFSNHPQPFLYPDGSLRFDPPSSVDKNEISKLALVPLDQIMNGSSSFLHSTSHAWAQADAFRSFILKMSSLNQTGE